MRTYRLRINGADHEIQVDGATPLLHVLRNDLGLRAAKVGCDAASQCGACAVLCDGEKIPSCSISVAEIGTRAITTAEGLGTRDAPSDLQRAFFAEQASQCGYCVPGMMIAATALLRKNPDPNEGEIKAALDRHICRCGTHVRIIGAVKRAATGGASLARESWPGATTTIAESDRQDARTAPSKAVAPVTSDAWLAISRDGAVTAYSGKIDMGTGVRTALAQIVADELDVEIGRVALVLADSARSPVQGKSTASCGVAIGGQPLRVACAAVRAALIERAGARLGVPAAELDTKSGAVFVKAAPERSIDYGELVGNEPLSVPLEVASESPWGPQLRGPADPKPRSLYRYVGTSIKRDVIVDHLRGSFTYVHNVVVPGMLHGRVVRPPTYFGGLASVDERSVSDLPGVRIVRRASFLGVVAEREEIAIEAAKRLQAQWSETAPLYDEQAQFEELRSAPLVAEQTGFAEGDAAAAIAQAPRRYEADFHFAYQLHAMLGPSCAVADVRDGRATIWSGSQWPNGDRVDIAAMLGMPVENVRLVYREAAGSYGRLGCDDAAADAALMSHLVERPVRVQWSRRDENGWEPVSAMMSMKVRAGLDGAGGLAALDYTQWSSTHASAERGNHVAWNLIGGAPGNDRLEGYLHGLHYDLAHKRGRTMFVAPTLRTMYLRGPGSVQSHFAIESAIDELAQAAGIDPIDYRLRHLPARDREVLGAVAELSRWVPHGGHATSPADARWRSGRGVAYTRSGVRPTLVGVVVDARVDLESGKVKIDKVFVAHDCGYMVNPDGVLNQVQGNIVHALSRALFEQVRYTKARVTSLDWNDYPVIRFTDIPEIAVRLIERPDLEPSVVGETASIPVVAAVANAIFAATGKRMRVAPFTPERVREARPV